MLEEALQKSGSHRNQLMIRIPYINACLVIHNIHPNNHSVFNLRYLTIKGNLTQRATATASSLSGLNPEHPAYAGTAIIPSCRSPIIFINLISYWQFVFHRLHWDPMWWCMTQTPSLLATTAAGAPRWLNFPNGHIGSRIAGFADSEKCFLNGAT